MRIGVTLTLADLSYRLVESPVRILGLWTSARHGARHISRVVVGEAPIGARLLAASLIGVVLVAVGVLAVGPKPSLSAAQRALAVSRGGRDLRIGHFVTATPSVSQVARRLGDLPPIPTVAATRRPATTAATSRQHGLPPISAFGDSVMLGARNALDRRFPGGTMDAVEGRQAEPILRDVDHDATGGRLNPLVIIGVGDNGLIDPTTLRHTLDGLRHAPGVGGVIVVNNRVGCAWQDPNNRTIADVVPQFANARILDWYAASASHPSWFYDDGIHLTSAGAAAYTGLLARIAANLPASRSR